jgi:UDP-N-acetylglucosamine 2-epimerase
LKLVAVAGARPNFMKIAPPTWEINRRTGINMYLVHTGRPARSRGLVASQIPLGEER